MPREGPHAHIKRRDSQSALRTRYYRDVTYTRPLHYQHAFLPGVIDCCCAEFPSIKSHPCSFTYSLRPHHRSHLSIHTFPSPLFLKMTAEAPPSPGEQDVINGIIQLYRADPAHGSKERTKSIVQKLLEDVPVSTASPTQAVDLLDERIELFLAMKAIWAESGREVSTTALALYLHLPIDSIRSITNHAKEGFAGLSMFDNFNTTAAFALASCKFKQPHDKRRVHFIRSR